MQINHVGRKSRDCGGTEQTIMFDKTVNLKYSVIKLVKIEQHRLKIYHM